MAGRAIMVQGTCSNAGKSVLAAALCRIFRQDGFRVAPFKAQNMSLNSYVTADGREIGRAQGAQAEAAGVEAEAIMNPVLLKPSGDRVAQVVLLGKPVGHFGAREYRQDYVPRVLPVVRDSLQELLARFDVVVIEGAGSPAEVNLKDRDIANMRVAEMAGAPVLLVADIDRGGALASIVGTLELLEPGERARVAGLIINKFRGDIDLLRPGLEFLETRTGKPVLGVIPYFEERLVDDEDSVSLTERPVPSARWRDYRGTCEGLDIAVIRLPRISNYTDFDPLEAEPGVRLRYVGEGEPLGSCDALILPGSKNTVGDLEYLRNWGYDRGLREMASSGVPVVGICGGYQMLGARILDPFGVESARPEVDGLGLLNTVTEFRSQKEVSRVRARVVADRGLLRGVGGTTVEGYEIHMGLTRRLEGTEPWLEVIERGGGRATEPEGALDVSGNVLGTYLHDIFSNREFRRGFLNALRRRRGPVGSPAFSDAPAAALSAAPELSKEGKYDRLAEIVRQNLDLDQVYKLLGIRREP